MERIASFTIDHTRLEPGVYVSRIDADPETGAVVTTFDLRSRVVYFGPMGCRTGFYLVLFGRYQSADVVDLVTSLFEFVASFKGDIPGATAEECGNYLDQNLPMARWHARRYLNRTLRVIDEAHLTYPA